MEAKAGDYRMLLRELWFRIKTKQEISETFLQTVEDALDSTKGITLEYASEESVDVAKIKFEVSEESIEGLMRISDKFDIPVTTLLIAQKKIPNAPFKL